MSALRCRSARVLAALAALSLRSGPLRAGDWLQLGGDPQHSGNAAQETVLSRANVSRLKRVWRASLGEGADGAPALLSGVSTPKGKRDVLFVTPGAGGVTALDAATGEVLWTSRPEKRAPLTTSCPAVDPGRQYVYGWGLDGSVHRWRVGDGVEAPGEGWPALVSRKPELEKASSCLAIATARSGRTYLYATTSSFGDDGNYQGHLTAIDVATGAQKVFNAVCSESAIHLDASGVPPSGCPEAGMGIWARAGAVYDAAADRILATASNGAFRPTPPSYAWGDTVLALAPDGSGNGPLPLDSYTPEEAETLGALDLDLGSTAVAILPRPAGARPRVGVQGGKDGVLRLLDLDDLGGRGGARRGGELFRAATPGGAALFGAPAVFASADGGVFTYVASASGLFAYRLAEDAAGGLSLVLAWQDARRCDFSTALVANGVVWVAATGRLSAFDAVTGERLFETNEIGEIHMQSPIVVDGVLYLVSDKFGSVDAWALDGRLPSAGESWVVASAARLPGANGAFYTTELTVANTADTEMLVSLRFAAHEADGRNGPVRSFLVGPGATVTYPDVLASVFGEETSYGAVHVSAPRAGLVIQARTSTPSAGGTFGQGITAVSSAFLQARGAVRSIPGVREDEAFRTNLILANGGVAELSVDVSALDAGGALLATKRYTLPPMGMTQVSRVLRDLGIAGPVRAARLQIASPDDGGLTAYASLIDNVTNDPSVLLAR